MIIALSLLLVFLSLPAAAQAPKAADADALRAGREGHGGEAGARFFRIEVAEIYPLADCHKHFVERVSIHLPAARCEDDKFRALKGLLRKQ